jgi:DnaJ-class molecular chaperone
MRTDDQKNSRCPACSGTGQEVRMTTARPGHPLPDYVECKRCPGMGRINRSGGDDAGGAERLAPNS